MNEEFLADLRDVLNHAVHIVQKWDKEEKVIGLQALALVAGQYEELDDIVTLCEKEAM